MELLGHVEKKQPGTFNFQESTLDMIEEIAVATGQNKSAVADHAVREYYSFWKTNTPKK